MDPDLHRLEDQLRLGGVVDLDEETRLAPLEMSDQVLEGDDFPVLRPNHDVFRRAAQRAERGLVLR